jgi:hypothetical protein
LARTTPASITGRSTSATAIAASGAARSSAGGREPLGLDLPELALAQRRPAREPAEVGRRLQARSKPSSDAAVCGSARSVSVVAVGVDRLLVGSQLRRHLGGVQRVGEVLRTWPNRAAAAIAVAGSPTCFTSAA